MAKYSKRSYGAKMGSAQELLTYISGFENYSPTRPEDSIENMTSMINDLLAVNSQVASCLEAYKTAVDARLKAFEKSENSVQKLLVQIKAAVESQYDRNSTEATMLNRIIKRMRAVKVKQDPAEVSETEEGVDKSTRRVDKSFKTLTSHFFDIVSTLEKFRDYYSSNERVKLPALKEAANNLAIFNSEVAKKTLEWDAATDHRKAKFNELRARSIRIKTYVKGQYGQDSKEFDLTKSLQF